MSLLVLAFPRNDTLEISNYTSYTTIPYYSDTALDFQGKKGET